jgi:hypothetical protein
MKTGKPVEKAPSKPDVVSDAPGGKPSTVQSKGWLSRAMPHGANLMASLKATMDPEIYAGMLDKLRRGSGWVVDHSTNIAVGSPPLDEYERGRVETRDGFAVMRVRLKARK